MITCQRDLFDIPGDRAYLNCAYMGPLPKKSNEAAIAAMSRKLHPWGISAADFFTGSEKLRALFAQLIGASPGDVALVPSVSYGIETAANNLAERATGEILLLEEQFPSNVYPWKELAAKTGATPKTVKRPPDGNWTRSVLGELSEKTSICALPACHWTDGSKLSLEEISHEAKRNGAALVLDLTQSLGAAPFEASAVRPDFMVAAGYKWLLGPYSLGYLYVDPAHQGGKPLENNWITRAGSDDFAGLVRYRDELQPGARRFDVGERSNFALVPPAIASLEQILDWGVGEIADTLSALTGEIAARGEALGLSVIDAGFRSPHMLGLRFPSAPPPDLVARFSEHNVHVSVRGDSVRVAPHLYNSPEDIDLFFSVLEKSL